VRVWIAANALLSIICLGGCHQKQSEGQTTSAEVRARSDSIGRLLPESTGAGSLVARDTVGLGGLARQSHPDSAIAIEVVYADSFKAASGSPPNGEMPGCEIPTCFRHKGDMLFKYSKYTVVLYYQDDYAGDSVVIFRHDSSSLNLDSVQCVLGKPCFSESGMGVWFFGIRGDLLFMDYGTSENHDFRIMDLLGVPKQVYVGDYESSQPSFELIAPDSLEFCESIGVPATERTCPQIKEWENDGLLATMYEQVVLSLSTFTKRRTGDCHCAPRD